MRIPVLVAAAVVALCGAPRVAAAEEKAEDPKDILALIDRMLADPIATTGKDLARVVGFARLSAAVTVDLRPEFCHAGKGLADRLLLGYCIAGAVKFDLEHPGQAADPYADKVTAMQASLVAYRAILKRQPDFKNALLQRLDRLEREGKLEVYVQAVAAKDRAKGGKK